jgi:hypothetical protein
LNGTKIGGFHPPNAGLDGGSYCGPNLAIALAATPAVEPQRGEPDFCCDVVLRSWVRCTFGTAQGGLGHVAWCAVVLSAHLHGTVPGATSLEQALVQLDKLRRHFQQHRRRRSCWFHTGSLREPAQVRHNAFSVVSALPWAAADAAGTVAICKRHSLAALH